MSPLAWNRQYKSIRNNIRFRPLFQLKFQHIVILLDRTKIRVVSPNSTVPQESLAGIRLEYRAEQNYGWWLRSLFSAMVFQKSP